VDDEPQVSAMLQETLNYLGYVAEVASSGEDALRALQDSQPNLLLLDVSLPGMSGVNVLERVHATYPHLPVVMLTGNVDLEVAQRTLNQGAFDYIAKPFDLARLRQVVEAAMAAGG
jgi:DNA-binding NtrC family response regulator